MLAGLSQCSHLVYGLATNDDFNGNVKDTAKWGTDTITGSGLLIATNQHLEFTVTNTPSSSDQDRRPWIVARGPQRAARLSS